jgi:hypothetical protein
MNSSSFHYQKRLLLDKLQPPEQSLTNVSYIVLLGFILEQTMCQGIMWPDFGSPFFLWGKNCLEKFDFPKME